jgi:hypothetical protein
MFINQVAAGNNFVPLNTKRLFEKKQFPNPTALTHPNLQTANTTSLEDMNRGNTLNHSSKLSAEEFRDALNIQPNAQTPSNLIANNLVSNPSPNSDTQITVAPTIQNTSIQNNSSTQITVAPLVSANQAPVAVNDKYQASINSISQQTSVLLNDTDAESNALSAIQTSSPQNGSVLFNPNGTFTYSPNPGFAGIDSFKYKANDGSANSNEATVTISVTPPTSQNAKLYALPDLFMVNKDSEVQGNVLANDSTVNNTSLYARLISYPQNGRLLLNSNGNFIYKPNPGFVGQDSFYYNTLNPNNGSDYSEPVQVLIAVSQSSIRPDDSANNSTDYFENFRRLFRKYQR